MIPKATTRAPATTVARRASNIFPKRKVITEAPPVVTPEEIPESESAASETQVTEVTVSSTAATTKQEPTQPAKSKGLLDIKRKMNLMRRLTGPKSRATTETAQAADES